MAGNYKKLSTKDFYHLGLIDKKTQALFDNNVELFLPKPTNISEKQQEISLSLIEISGFRSSSIFRNQLVTIRYMSSGTRINFETGVFL